MTDVRIRRHMKIDAQTQKEDGNEAAEAEIRVMKV